jgi:hypothetical protein
LRSWCEFHAITASFKDVFGPSAAPLLLLIPPLPLPFLRLYADAGRIHGVPAVQIGFAALPVGIHEPEEPFRFAFCDQHRASTESLDAQALLGRQGFRNRLNQPRMVTGERPISRASSAKVLKGFSIKFGGERTAPARVGKPSPPK